MIRPAPATFLVFGRTGMGKSSLINRVFGRYIAETAEFEACTRLVAHHAYGTPWGNLVLIDTPGFAEDGPAEDLRAVDMIAAHVDLPAVTAALMVTRLDETRLRADETRMIELLTERFGQAMWLKSWLVMTHAASVPATERAARSVARQGSLRDFVSGSIAKREGRPSFADFQQAWLVDNVVSNWCQACVPMGQVLGAAA